MNTLLTPISTETFNDLITVKFSNILDGFDKFINCSLTPLKTDNENNEKLFIDFITEIFHENNNECIIDLYLCNISPEDKARLASLLDEDDRSMLELIDIDYKFKTVYFKLTNEKLIPLITRLSTRELFFTTFYFYKKPITIWGNYNFNFPCFFEKMEDKKFYEFLASSFVLSLK